VHTRVTVASFYWPPGDSGGIEEPASGAYVEARVRGGAAHAVSIALDGRPVGTAPLVKGESRVVVARPATSLFLAPGGHELSLQLVGGSRATDETLAEIDWVHVGVGDVGEPYAAPTRSEVLVDVVVGGRAERALSLRAPGFARCSGWIPADTTLEVSLATQGGGEADVEALLLRDRRPPVVLGTAHVADAEQWAPWSVPIAGLERDGALASIELVARRATKGTRVLFGAPRVVAADAVSAVRPPVARAVLLVVLGSTSAMALAPWGGAHRVPELVTLAGSATTFMENRAPSTLPSAALASLLTGLSPLDHGLDEGAERLSSDPTTVQEACRQGGIATAMFTADPTTGAAFGFARGWDVFVSRDPMEDAPATRVFDDAAAWIEARKGDRYLAVVHARGGHPPWDVSPDELKDLPPAGYLGMIDPARAAEALAKARKHPARFKEDDRVRAWALYDHAIDQHDAALGRLLGALRAAGRDGDTTIIVTGDVAASQGAAVPFSESDALDEPQLATPLVIRWPGATTLSGRRVDALTGPVDLATTVMNALGLAAPSAFQGADLAAVAQGAVVPTQRPQLATRGGRFSVRWGTYVLAGARGREWRLCDLSLDPACIADVRGTSPLALEAMRTWAVSALSATGLAAHSSRTAVDERTSAALVRWGRDSEGQGLTRNAGQAH
jgi:arylsulfatase A-like enzyme